MSKLAPPRFASLLMGAWFVSLAFGNFRQGYSPDRSTTSSEARPIAYWEGRRISFSSSFLSRWRLPLRFSSSPSAWADSPSCGASRIG